MEPLEPSFRIWIEGLVDIKTLLEPFKTIGCQIDYQKLLAGRQADKHHIPIVMIPVGTPCADTDSLCQKMASLLIDNQCRPLWDFEALVLNKSHPEIQMKTPFVTQSLAFGVPEMNLYVGPDREKHGLELWSLAKYSKYGTPAHLLIAATPMTAVDKKEFNGQSIEESLRMSGLSGKV